MGLRPSSQNCNNTVQKYIGTGYDTVKKVANNIDDVTLVAESVGDLNTASDNIDSIVEVSNDISSVIEVADKMDSVTNVGSNITEVINTGSNIPDIITVSGSINNVNNVSGNIQEIGTVAENINDVNIVAENVDNLNEIVDLDIPALTVEVLASKDDAENAANRAEAAADVATLNEKIFDTVALGLAGTVNGDYFSVVSPNAEKYLDLYKNDGGSAVFQKSYPSYTAVKNLKTELIDESINYTGGNSVRNDDILPMVTDENFNVLAGYSKSKDEFFAKGLITNSEFELYNKPFEDAPVGFNEQHKEVSAIVTDQDLRVVIGYRPDTNTILTPNPVPNSRVLPSELWPVPSKYNHICHYTNETMDNDVNLGQITNYSNVMFEGGIFSWSLNPDAFNSFIPLVNDTNKGSVVPHMASVASRYIYERSGVAPSEHIILGSEGGDPASFMNELIPPALKYDRTLGAQVSGGYTLDSGYSLQVFGWASDREDVGDSYTVYYEKLERMQRNICSNVYMRIKQESPTFMFLRQTSVEALTNADAMIAMYDVCIDNKKIMFISPTYHLPGVVGPGETMSSLGAAIYGAYVGRAYQQLMFEKRTPDCLEYISCTHSGNIIKIKYNVPTKPLQLNTTDLAATTDMGFKVLDDNGDVTITDISIENGDTVVITCDSLNGGVVVRYALDYLGGGLNIDGGASGNVSDSTEDSLTIYGNDVKLLHVAPHYQITSTKLEEL